MIIARRFEQEAVFDGLFAVRRQDSMGLDAIVRKEYRSAISPPGRQLSVLVKLDCGVRQGFFRLNPNTWFRETSNCVLAKLPGRCGEAF